MKNEIQVIDELVPDRTFRFISSDVIPDTAGRHLSIYGVKPLAFAAARIGDKIALWPEGSDQYRALEEARDTGRELKKWLMPGGGIVFE